MISLNSLKIQKQQIEQITSNHHASDVFVFGSVARGENTENSDIDLLVSFNPEASLFDQAGIIDELSELLNCPVDVVSRNALNPLLSDKILSEAVKL